MADAVFPELPGLDWNATKTPAFNTKVMTSINGRELRASYQAVPKYTITLSYTFLRERQGRNELQQLEAFFYERRGSFDSFLFKMPDDYQYNCQIIGDGKTRIFQLYKSMFGTVVALSHTQEMRGFLDVLMWNKNPKKLMWSKDKDSLMWRKIPYIVNKLGFIEISEPLAEGQIGTIKGVYYYRCRFKDDTQQYTNFAEKLWSAKKVEFIGSLGNKV